MANKSHVSIAQKFCPICGKPFDSGEILLETRIVNGKLAQTLDRFTCTGVDLCPEHMAMVESGEYTAFFVCEERDCGKCKQFSHRYGKKGAYEQPSADKCKLQQECGGQHYTCAPKNPLPDDGCPGEPPVYLRRTGDGFMMRSEDAKDFFNATLAPINHCDMELFEKIKGMMPETSNQEPEGE